MSQVTVDTAVPAKTKTPSASRIITVSGMGLLFDSMDNSLLSFVLVSLAAAWHLSSGMTGFLGSVSFIGMAIGSALAGLLADRFGRRNMFMWTLLIYSLATGATALAGGVGIFVALRFLVGFGLGGELPVATTYVLESSPEHVRGRRVVFLESFWAIGALVASLVSFFVLPSVGWRMVFLVGAIPALYVFGLRFGLPEAKRYAQLQERPKISKALKTLFDKEHRRASVVTWILWFENIRLGV